jgi:hypothetical protein
MLVAKADELASLHRELLPLSDVDFGAEGFGARIFPYQAVTRPAQPVTVDVEVVNPFGTTETVSVELVVPAGWSCAPPATHVRLPGRDTGSRRTPSPRARPGDATTGRPGAAPRRARRHRAERLTSRGVRLRRCARPGPTRKLKLTNDRP